jgi:phage repressor protein C with HTH and peptisase S24 domain
VWSGTEPDALSYDDDSDPRSEDSTSSSGTNSSQDDPDYEVSEADEDDQLTNESEDELLDHVADQPLEDMADQPRDVVEDVGSANPPAPTIATLEVSDESATLDQNAEGVDTAPVSEESGLGNGGDGMWDVGSVNPPAPTIATLEVSDESATVDQNAEGVDTAPVSDESGLGNGGDGKTPGKRGLQTEEIQNAQGQKKRKLGDTSYSLVLNDYRDWTASNRLPRLGPPVVRDYTSFLTMWPCEADPDSQRRPKPLDPATYTLPILLCDGMQLSTSEVSYCVNWPRPTVSVLEAHGGAR